MEMEEKKYSIDGKKENSFLFGENFIADKIFLSLPVFRKNESFSHLPGAD